MSEFDAPHRSSSEPRRQHAAKRARSSTTHGSTVRLRSDLLRIESPHCRRDDVVLVDEIGSRYVRVSPPELRQLERLSQGADESCDTQLLTAAANAGLLRNRQRPGRRSLRRFNPFVVRLPGVSVDPLSRWLAVRTNWLFSPAAVVCWTTVVAIAAIAIPVQWERFARSLPALRDFFAAGNLPLLIATMVVTKAIHELGHATVCRRMGARCGDVGILLLCGAPCPYCDVTDSWRLPSAMRRSAIMLAGVYVELILAAVASFVWWFTSPGTLHFAALNVMVVCSVSTLLFNMNPLMRYDGYYVLSDLVRSYHLREEAATAFRRCIMRPLARNRSLHRTSTSGRERLLAIYHAAASAYRVAVTILIALWIWHLADALALRSVGTIAATGMLLAVPAASAKRWLGLVLGRGGWRTVGHVRRLTLAVALAALVACGLLIPVRQTELASGRVDAVEAAVIYTPETARIADVRVGFGDRVEAGQVLATLENPELERQWLEVAGKHQALQLQIRQLRLQAIEQTDLLEQLDTQQAAAEALKQQAARLEHRLEQLKLTAPSSGILLPVLPDDRSFDPGSPEHAAVGLASRRQPSSRPAVGSSDGAAPGMLSHDLFAARGTWVHEDAAWGRIATAGDAEVTLEVDSRLRASVQVGDRVRLRCEQSPALVIDAVVESISTIHRTTATFVGAENRFRVSCRLPEQIANRWQIGSAVTAQLELPPEPLLRRIVRWWRETMRVG